MYDSLPPLRPYNNNPRAGLDDSIQWCRGAETVVEQIPSQMDLGVLREYVDLLTGLRDFPEKRRPEINEELRRQIEARLKKLLDRFTERLGTGWAGFSERVLANRTSRRSAWAAEVICRLLGIARQRCSFEATKRMLQKRKVLTAQRFAFGWASAPAVADGEAMRATDEGMIYRTQKLDPSPTDEPIDVVGVLKRGLNASEQSAFQACVAWYYHYSEVDTDYTAALVHLQEDIDTELRKINQLDETPTAKLFDAYDNLINGGVIQQRFAELGRHYDVDEIAEHGFEGESESHCSLVDGIIATFRVLHQKATSAEVATPELLSSPSNLPVETMNPEFERSWFLREQAQKINKLANKPAICATLRNYISREFPRPVDQMLTYKVRATLTTGETETPIWITYYDGRYPEHAKLPPLDSPEERQQRRAVMLVAIHDHCCEEQISDGLWSSDVLECLISQVKKYPPDGLSDDAILEALNWLEGLTDLAKLSGTGGTTAMGATLDVATVCDLGKYAFRRSGETGYLARFDGGEPCVIPRQAGKLPGLDYIHVLLRHEAEHRRSPHAVPSALDARDVARKADSAHEDHTEPRNPQKLIDHQTWNESQKRRDKLPRLIEKADDPAEELILEEELQQLNNYLSKSTWPGRKNKPESRTFSDDNTKKWDSIRNGVNRAIDIINQQLPALADHLRLCISHSEKDGHRYAPAPRIDWDLG